MAQKENYIGQHIGYLTVIRHSTRYPDIYHARCRCGKIIKLSSLQVRHQSVHACPECAKMFPTARNDITCKKFGVFTVLYPSIVDGVFQRSWVVKCNHCGKVHEEAAGDLKYARSYACPICNAGKSLEDQMDINFSLVGRTFGQLRVLHHNTCKRFVREGNDDWECKCICGEQVTFSRQELFSGLYNNCGGAAHRYKKIVWKYN